METLMDCDDLPVIVARGASSPFICVLVPGIHTDVTASGLPKEGCGMCSGECAEDAPQKTFEQENSYLVDMQTIDVHKGIPVSTMNINVLPTPVQNALRRQWSGV